MQGKGRTQRTFVAVSLRNGNLTSSSGQMTVCRRPDCDRAAAAEHTLGFCDEDHAAYARSREGYASLAEAAQVVHASAFAIVPVGRRQILAEYLVAVASEELSEIQTDIPRPAVLMAAALVARGRIDLRLLDSCGLRRRGARHARCVAVKGLA